MAFCSPRAYLRVGRNTEVGAQGSSYGLFYIYKPRCRPSPTKSAILPITVCWETTRISSDGLCNIRSSILGSEKTSTRWQSEPRKGHKVESELPAPSSCCAPDAVWILLFQPSGSHHLPSTLTQKLPSSSTLTHTPFLQSN